MRGYMFRNRWFALLFVGITLAGVTRLVGTGEDHGAIQEAADQIAETRAQAEQMTTETAALAGEADAVETAFAEDEELIDQALGEDPTPIDEFAAANPAEPEVPTDEVIIVSRDVPGQPAPAQPAVPQPQAALQ